jgi:sugar lactone lactonase YvrE
MRIRLLSFFLFLGSLSAQNIFTIAGIPYSHRHDVDGVPALSADLGSVYGVLIDKTTGRLLLNDQALVSRLEPDGTLLALVGSGTYPPIQFNTTPLLGSTLMPAVWRGMAQDSSGALYLADAGGSRIYRVGLDGAITIFAGFTPQSPLNQVGISPRGMVFDSKGKLDFADAYCNCIRQVSPVGTMSTFYTLPSSNPYGGPNVGFEGLTIDSSDNLYFTEWQGHRVVKVSADGSSTTVIAGTGVAGFSGDGGPAPAAQLNGPTSVTLDSSGNIYIADTLNNRIRMVAPNGNISTFAGNGVCGATSTRLCSPAQTLIDSTGAFIVADYGNARVRRIASDGTISTVVGSGRQIPVTNGDGGPVIHATFKAIGGIAFDSAGNLYVGDSFAFVIRKIATDGTVSTVAGNGTQGYSGDGGAALQAQMYYPGPIAFGPDGALYVITGDDRIRKITPDGNISLVAGTGPGSSLIRSQGDGGPAVNATLNEPASVAFDQNGNIFIADTSNARIRKIDPHGIITTVAGPGVLGTDYYNAVAVDPKGTLYLAWTHLSGAAGLYATVNRVNADGSLARIAGSQVPCANGPLFMGDGGSATAANLCAVTALTVDPAGLPNFADGDHHLLLRVNSDGTIQRVAGNEIAQTLGDGGPVLQASLNGFNAWSPETPAFDLSGTMYIVQPGVNVIRIVTNTPYSIQASPSQINAHGALTQSVSLSANFAEPFPYSVIVTNGGSWLATNRTSGTTEEPVKVFVNPTGLPSGTYLGTVRLVTQLQEVDVPVTVTVP